MAFRRPRLLRLDRLVIGADPRKLGLDTPASTPKQSIPLSDKERGRLAALNTKKLYNGPLTPQEAYERLRLSARIGAR